MLLEMGLPDLMLQPAGRGRQITDCARHFGTRRFPDEDSRKCPGE